MSVLSVDLGTSTTVAVLAADGRPPHVVEVDGAPNLPSAVLAAEDGRLVVGREAERQARLDPARFEPNPKRRIDEGTLLLGDRVVPVTEAFAAVLAKIAAEVSRRLGGALPDEVRLTHPARWGPVGREVLLAAARQARLGANLVPVPEPVAAAAHFASFPGRSLAHGQALVVCDLGAGTCDVAVVGVTRNGFVVLAEAGLPGLGGLDVDQALLAHLGRQVSARDPEGWQRLVAPDPTADRRAQRALREDVRAAKEALSGHPRTEVPLPEPFGAVLVTRAELENLIRPDLMRGARLLADTVRTAGVTPDRLAGVHLVGGSSRIPLVATMIAEQLGIAPTTPDQPETAVALGALHVPREGTSLRTDALPEERTTHIAQRGMGSPVTARPPVPPHASGPPAPVRPGTRRRRRWLIAALAFAVVVAAYSVVLAIVEGGPGERNGPAVASPKELPGNLPCESVVPIADVSDEFGTTAQAYDGQRARCSWAAADSAADSTSAALSLDEAYLVTGSEGEPFTIGGNSANRRASGDSCSVAVAIQADTTVEVWATDEQGDHCGLAESLLRIAFDRLPGA